MDVAVNAREHNRRVKQAIAMLKAAGAERVVVEILPDGATRVVEARDDADDDEAARLGRLIEGLGNA